MPASNKDFLVVFSSPQGKRVLSDLMKAYSDRISYTQGDPHDTAFREGQRSVMARIVTMMRQAKNGKMTDEILESLND